MTNNQQNKKQMIEQVKKEIDELIRDKNVIKLKSYITSEFIRKTIIIPLLIKKLKIWLDCINTDVRYLYYDAQQDPEIWLEGYKDLVRELKEDFLNYMQILHLICIEIIHSSHRQERVLQMINRGISALQRTILKIIDQLYNMSITPEYAYDSLVEPLNYLFMFLNGLSIDERLDYTILAFATESAKRKSTKAEEKIKEEYLVVGRMIVDLYNQTNAPVSPKQLRQVAPQYGIEEKFIPPAIKVLKRRGLIIGDAKSGYTPSEELINMVEAKQGGEE